jgi:hypothetical protein
MDFDLNSGLLTLIVILVGWIKLDISSLWKRVNKHRHVVKCANKQCDIIIGEPTTGEG